MGEKSSTFSDIKPCSLLKSEYSKLFSACYLSHAGLLLGLFFGPEDGANIFLRNVGWFSMYHTAKIELSTMIAVRISNPTENGSISKKKKGSHHQKEHNI
jgi:hypothetical protein